MRRRRFDRRRGPAQALRRKTLVRTVNTPWRHGVGDTRSSSTRAWRTYPSRRARAPGDGQRTSYTARIGNARAGACRRACSGRSYVRPLKYAACASVYVSLPKKALCRSKRSDEGRFSRQISVGPLGLEPNTAPEKQGFFARWDKPRTRETPRNRPNARGFGPAGTNHTSGISRPAERNVRDGGGYLGRGPCGHGCGPVARLGARRGGWAVRRRGAAGEGARGAAARVDAERGGPAGAQLAARAVTCQPPARYAGCP